MNDKGELSLDIIYKVKNIAPGISNRLAFFTRVLISILLPSDKYPLTKKNNGKCKLTINVHKTFS
jgi:hypothetical protein